MGVHRMSPVDAPALPAHRSAGTDLARAYTPPARREPNMGKEHDLGRIRRGAVVPQTGKTRIAIYLDDEIPEEFRERADSVGRGCETQSPNIFRIISTPFSRMTSTTPIRLSPAMTPDATGNV